MKINEIMVMKLFDCQYWRLLRHAHTQDGYGEFVVNMAAAGSLGRPGIRLSQKMLGAELRGVVCCPRG